MTVTVYSFIYGFLFLWLGLLEYAAVNRLIYPRLRWRYEQTKVTGTHGINPSVLLTVAKLIGLVAMPVLGFYLGSMVMTDA
ncbi:hypothetical protein [Rhodoligotrophos defluvii]|uniref:hypothetical protein n=1 Tax=Rhodoligotrophos defluvii TaxID=2561934 RepID=UPI0010C9AD34|nr:hypothetical protein [Rhodoligotrophos defluvii]